MPVTVTAHPNGRMVDYGEDLRIEREFTGDRWVLYVRVPTGAVLDDKGAVVTLGQHPAIKQADGSPAPTHVTHVWMPQMRGEDTVIRAEAERRAGLKE